VIKPTFEQLQVAALWLENNEGDEGADCMVVAKWLQHVANENFLRSTARKAGVTVTRLRRKLAEQANLSK
jgi:DNA-binding phage protein